MNMVKWVKENRSKLKPYEWLKQFDEDTDGYRFHPMKFLGMKIKYGTPDPPPDGIAGDRWMKAHLKTKVVGGLTLDDLRKGLGPDKCNDFINYTAWNSFDLLSLRITEGLSELIPRAQYEYTGYGRAFLRGSEFNKYLIHKVGWKNYMRRFYDSRKELGSQVETISHCWSIIAGSLYGAVGLETQGYFEPDDPLIIDKKIWTILPFAARAYALYGGDGYTVTSQNRYVANKDDSVIDFIMNHMEPVDKKKLELFQMVDGASSLLGYSTSYDCRAGQCDNGPHIVEGGKILVIRANYINEPVFPWSEVSEKRGLPFSVILGFMVNPEKMGLQEWRVNDIGTSFSRPANFWPAVEQVCMFLRYEPDGPKPLPLSKLKKLEWSETPDFVNKMNDATREWYFEVAKMTRRQKAVNGYQVYSWTLTGGSALRGLGLWDYYRDELDYFEMPPLVSDTYYQMEGKMTTDVLPNKLFKGGGWTDIPVKAATKSRYRDEVLKRAYDLGWVSDLTGTRPIPADIKDMMDGDRVFQGVPKFDVPDDWMK